MQNEEQAREFAAIQNLLKKNPQDFTGYKRLGTFYHPNNVNQAFLCYEQARELCIDEKERMALERRMQVCREEPGFQVQPASFRI